MLKAVPAGSVLESCSRLAVLSAAPRHTSYSSSSLGFLAQNGTWWFLRACGEPEWVRLHRACCFGEVSLSGDAPAAGMGSS